MSGAVDDLKEMKRAIDFAVRLLRDELGPGGLVEREPEAAKETWRLAISWLGAAADNPMIPLWIWRQAATGDPSSPRAPRLLHGKPFPPHDPRGWPEYQDCASDICAAFGRHTPECSVSRSAEPAQGHPQAEIMMRDGEGR